MLLDRFKLLATLAALIFADSTEVVAHGSVHEQISQITKQLERNPIAELHLKRGELFYFHNDWNAALADYDTAAVLDPELDIVDLYRSTTLLAAGRFNSAQEAVERFLQKKPEHRQALLTSARIHVKLEDYLAAVANYDQFLRLQNKAKPTHYLERAQALINAGPEHIEAALAGIDAGLDKLGQIVTLQLHAIDLELKLNRVDAALERLERISAQSARKEKWLFRKGEILTKGGRDQEARQAYDLALQSITALPKSRREAKAIRELEARIRAALHL